jgi:hypothetical protein
VRLRIQFLLTTLSMLFIWLCLTDALPAERGSKSFDCEGDACPVVRLTRQQDRQQFKVQNDFERVNDPGARVIGSVPTASDECEGDACSQVTVTWEEAKERYKVRNNSADQWVRVEAANLAATAATCVEPGKEAYLSLKSIVGTYKAKFDATCAVD